MDTEVSPYLESMQQYQYPGGMPSYTSIQMPPQNYNAQAGYQQIPQPAALTTPSMNKKRSIELSIDMTTIMYIIAAILLIYVVYIYISDENSEWFTIGTTLSDPAHDKSYLEENIELLNKMQDENFA